MSKVIEIKGCGECPYRGKTICLHPEIVQKVNTTEDVQPIELDSIPRWCPLEDKDDFCESNFDIDRKF